MAVIKGSIDPDKAKAFVGDRKSLRMTLCSPVEASVFIRRSGAVSIYTNDEQEGERILCWIQENLDKQVEVGIVFSGRVTKMMAFGAFLALDPVGGQEGFLHISNYPETGFEVGDLLEVKVLEIDLMGRVNLEMA
jgi:polyribonucleotide nucleotidyltransferase